MKKVISTSVVKSAGDRVIRCFLLETLIPRYPKYKTVAQLQEELITHGKKLSHWLFHGASRLGECKVS